MLDEEKKIAFPILGENPEQLITIAKSSFEKVHRILSQEYGKTYRINIEKVDEPGFYLATITISINAKSAVSIQVWARISDVNKFLFVVRANKTSIRANKTLKGLSDYLFSPNEFKKTEMLSDQLYCRVIPIVEGETGLEGWTHRQLEANEKNK